MNVKRFSFILVSIYLVSAWAPSGWAQSQSPPSSLQREGRQALVQRVGIDPARRSMMSLHDVIILALQNNQDIEIERINGQMAEHQLASARGAYDPSLNVLVSFESSTVPVGSVLAGGESGSVATDRSVYDASLRQLLPTGAEVELFFDNSRQTSSNVFNSLNPQFDSTLRFTFRQPLLRNRGIDENRRAIRIARKRLDLSDAQFRRRVIEVINQVQKAYWDLVFALRNVQVQQQAVDLADRQMEMNRRMVEAGTLAPVEIIAAEAEVKRREENVLTAVEGLSVAENTLKQLILARRTDRLWNAAIIPTESVEIQTVPIDLSAAVQVALKSRPEIQQLRFQREINDTDVRYARNQTRPQVDVVGTYEINGLAGDVRSGDNPFSSANNVLQDRVNELSELAGLPPLNVPPPGQLPPFLLGGQGQALSNLFGNDFRTVSVGISIGLPLRNRKARGQLGQALAEQRLLRAQDDRLEQAVEVDVRTSLQAMETARKRVDASRAARKAAEVSLQSEERRYRAGETTNFLVLTRQNELSAARSHELRALMDYNKAVAELQRATATTLNAYNVNIDSSQSTR